MLTVVMYHYVRRLAGSRFPEIEGLEQTFLSSSLATFGASILRSRPRT